jgi:hypothetical protein
MDRRLLLIPWAAALFKDPRWTRARAASRVPKASGELQLSINRTIQACLTLRKRRGLFFCGNTLNRSHNTSMHDSQTYRRSRKRDGVPKHSHSNGTGRWSQRLPVNMPRRLCRDYAGRDLRRPDSAESGEENGASEERRTVAASYRYGVHDCLYVLHYAMRQEKTVELTTRNRPQYNLQNACSYAGRGHVYREN